MVAVALGGSHAGGTAGENSDLDLGLYYREAAPFSITDIQRIAAAVSVPATPIVTGFYEWGHWVNGGAWIETAAGKVDLLYRNLDQVERTIDEARQGSFQQDYGQQPTHGFYNVTYLAETRACLPLYDPEMRIAELKRRVEVYPEKLKKSIVAGQLWSAEFTLSSARGHAAGGDVYNTAGCLSRVAASLTQVLFALNEEYPLGDKRVFDVVAAFPILPPGYVSEVIRILARPGETAAELQSAVAGIEAVWRSVVSLAGAMYRPRFNLPGA